MGKHAWYAYMPADFTFYICQMRQKKGRKEEKEGGREQGREGGRKKEMKEERREMEKGREVGKHNLAVEKNKA